MKTLLITLLLVITSSAAMACEQMPRAFEQQQTLQSALTSDAYDRELSVQYQDYDVTIVSVRVKNEQVRVLLSNKCTIVVTVEMAQMSGGGECPTVKAVTAKTVCR